MALTPFTGLGADPFGLFNEMERSINRAFGRALGGPVGTLGGPIGTSTALTAPTSDWLSAGGMHPMDISETDKSYLITADAPGFTPEDIHVEVTNEGVLNIRAEKNLHREEKDAQGRVVRRERQFRNFQRSFQLPENCNRDSITAQLDKGLLKLELQKVPEPEKPQPKRITVGAGGATTSGGQSA